MVVRRESPSSRGSAAESRTGKAELQPSQFSLTRDTPASSLIICLELGLFWQFFWQLGYQNIIHFSWWFISYKNKTFFCNCEGFLTFSFSTHFYISG